MARHTIEIPSQSSGFKELLGLFRCGGSHDPLLLSGEPSSTGFRADDEVRLPAIAEALVTAPARTAAVLWRDVAQLLPAMEDADPATALAAMHERFVGDPSEENAALLQSAINNVTQSPVLRDQLTDQVQAAKQVFHSGEGLNGAPIADNIWYEAYADVNFGGPEFFTSMTPNWCYWRQPDFRDVRAVYSSARAQDVISSVQFGSSGDEVGGHVVFFEHVRFSGRYLNFSVPPGGRRDVPWIGADFNDLASSALIIRRFRDELPPVSIARNLTLPPLTTLTAGSQFADAISYDGTPVTTWDMWPSGRTSGDDWHPNDSGKIFVELIVPLRLKLQVQVGWSPKYNVDYRLQAKYWISVFVRNGQIDATVDYYGWHVESGLLTDYIAPQLKAMVAGSVPAVSARVQATLARLRAVSPRLSFCYLLPGRNDERGNVTDDVTLVCVR